MKRSTRFVGLVALLAACAAQEKVLGPYGPPQDPGSGVARAAFLAQVDLQSRRVTITAPTIDPVTSASARSGGPDWSLVGGDAVLLTTSNFSASAVGAFLPGKVRVAFDVSMTNRLASLDIAGPTTFPAPPPGTTGPLLFPYDIAVATTSGGTSTGGQGGDVIVVLPGGGLVAPSADWDGAPFNFFNDSGCGGNDCYRWEEFPVIPAGGTTTTRRVGFDIDPTVGQFTARLIVASDLVDLGLPQPGSVQGLVSSTAIGPIAGAVVTASPGGATAITSPTGTFQLAGLPPGTVDLTVTGVPAICAAPTATPVVVATGTVTTVSLPVVCTPPPLLGTVMGQITLAGGPGLAGVGVVITPSGGPSLPPQYTDTLGDFMVTSVPVSDGSGTVTLTQLPATCTDPGPIPYSTLTVGGTATLGVAVSCTTPPGGYPLTAVFAGSGSAVTLTFAIDLSPYNDLFVNGVAPDDIQSIQGSFTYDPARLQLVGCAAVPISAMANLTVNSSVAGTVQFLNFTSAGGPVVGLQGIAACTFTDLGGPPVTTATTLTLARSFDGHDLLPHILVAEGVLP